MSIELENMSNAGGGNGNGVYKSPYVYFGGKSKVAAEVWLRFGKVDRYIEPFFGSGAVLLANPYWLTTKEIVNDKDQFLANCWRSIRRAPEEVAYWCDYPTLEVELHLFHIWLVNEGRERIAECEWNENHYDAEVAGKWLYGMANWIGGGFASGQGSWTRETLRLANKLKTYDLREIKKHCGNEREGQGVNRQRPHLSNEGQGVNRKLPAIAKETPTNNLISLFPANEGLYQYIRQLSERFIEVDVCCGDWKRIMQPAVSGAGDDAASNNTAAIFLDPPYSAKAERSTVYSIEDFSVAHEVREWCLQNGDNPKFRIALCGYEIEHSELEKQGWKVFSWKASGGYSGPAKNALQGKTNRSRETIWFSPHCHWNSGLFDADED